MHILQTHWRKMALLLPVAAVIAAVAFFLGGTAPVQDRAFATGGTDTSGLTCTNLFLAELLNPSPADAFPGNAVIDRVLAQYRRIFCCPVFCFDDT